MRFDRLARAAAALLFTLAATGSAGAQTELRWWHSMTGAAAEAVDTLARDFNAAQGAFRVVPVFKGSYPETLQAGLAAFRSGNQPHIIQVFDVGTGVMMSSEGVIVPVAEILEKAGRSFDKSQYLPGIVAYYSTPDGRMLSFPFNSSSPVLYYNRTLFEKAGLDPADPPETWPEVWAVARRIVRSGAAACGFTSTWLTWIHLENFAAWNNVPYASNENGLAGNDITLAIDAPIYVRHFQEIAALAADGVFRYGGRTSQAKQLFLGGECAILTESSGAIGDFDEAGMAYGIGPLPYVPGAPDRPQNTVPGGASLWVFAGHEDQDYQGVAAFFEYLSRPEVQLSLHEKSGYLPVTTAAYAAARKAGFYEAQPGREQPIRQMMGRQPTANSRGVRAINLPQLRDIQNEELEAMLAGTQDARTALQNAARRSNEAIRKALGP